ncbi:Gfo/Idh/MocA family oxidoreductase [Salinibacterium sp. NG253]|uniref:Gfo/Idh/MocA family oxidoreductase n=1 Tax=Salinibacterium sp. NG253 TaxID=2792039 RepID=UPI0018CF8C01|nr:Gfo/Idh/MocA family oxidoreductase [Salinibacterium sp. NG253]MBH0117310.1 Gfo/Idh/MocA family oxidoreductase [Salinibacterium sp. NG253]
MPTVAQPRIGFVGAGLHSSLNLYPAFAATGVPLVGVAERNPARVAEAEARGIHPIFPNHLALIEASNLDGIVVSLAPHLQADVVADCVRAGVAVFVEKPLGSTEAEADEIAEIAADAGVPVMLGFMKRFAPAYTQLKALIGEDTEQGPVLSYACEFGFAAWKPDFTPVEFITQAVIHLIDLVRDIFGEVVDVSAIKNSVGDGLAIIVQVRHESGVVGSLNFVSARAWSRETEELSVTCTNGVVRVSDLSRIQVLTGEVAGTTAGPGETLAERSVTFDVSNSPGSGSLKDLYLRGYVGEMKHFVGVLQGTEQLSPSAADNVRTMALCDTILAAISD